MNDSEFLRVCGIKTTLPHQAGSTDPKFPVWIGRHYEPLLEVTLTSLTKQVRELRIALDNSEQNYRRTMTRLIAEEERRQDAEHASKTWSIFCQRLICAVVVLAAVAVAGWVR